MARTILTLIFCFCFSIQADSQSSWQEHESPISADLHNITFVNDSLGWIVSHKTGAILHSRDSGKNWFVQAQMDSIFFEDIFFLNAEEGWISANNGLILKTSNGGENWKKRKIADAKSWIYDIHFFNSERGIAVGLRESKPMKIFLVTNDGGKSWNQLDKTIPETFYSTLTFLEDSKGYSAGLRFILHTSDRGNTWNVQFADTSSPPKKAPVIRDIAFSNQKNGIAVGHQGLILKTIDGKNWKERPPFTKNLLRSVAFTDPEKGYIVSDSNNQPGVLYRTKNGGKTWKTVLRDTPDLHHISITNNTIWLVGDNGTILSKSISN